MWTVAPTNFNCMSGCPAFAAYISLTTDRILIKLSENVGTSIRLIVLKFHKTRIRFDVIMTSFLSFNLFIREATLLKGTQLYTSLRQTVTLATAIFLFENILTILKFSESSDQSTVQWTVNFKERFQIPMSTLVRLCFTLKLLDTYQYNA